MIKRFRQKSLPIPEEYNCVKFNRGSACHLSISMSIIQICKIWNYKLKIIKGLYTRWQYLRRLQRAFKIKTRIEHLLRHAITRMYKSWQQNKKDINYRKKQTKQRTTSRAQKTDIIKHDNAVKEAKAQYTWGLKLVHDLGVEKCIEP